MWFYCRLLRISWTSRISNEEVLERAGIKRELLELICKRQHSFLGHIYRKGLLKSIVLMVKLKGKEQERTFLESLSEKIRW